jgi:hypothetical protein
VTIVENTENICWVSVMFLSGSDNYDSPDVVAINHDDMALQLSSN